MFLKINRWFIAYNVKLLFLGIIFTSLIICCADMFMILMSNARKGLPWKFADEKRKPEERFQKIYTGGHDHYNISLS